MDRPTMSTSSSRAAATIWAGRESDALVDDLEAGVPGGHGDLFGPVGVTVQPRLGHQQPGWPPGRLGQRPGPGHHRAQLGPAVPDAAPDTPVGARYSPKTSRRPPAHSPVVPPAWARAMVGAIRSAVPCPRRPAAGRRGPAARRRRRGPRRHRATSAAARPRRSGRPSRCSRPPSSAVSGEGAVSVKQLTPTTCCSPLSIRRTRSAWLRTEPGLQLLDGLEGPAQGQHVVQLGLGRLGQLGRLGLHDHRSPRRGRSYSSRSDSKARICWMRSDHCWSQGRGRPRASFQAGSWMARARALGRQGHPERLEHDAGHVVLGLGLGQPERVDLHPVAEPAELRVVDAVALGADAVPHGGEGPHLAGLLDEADAGVDEEADPPDDLPAARPRSACPSRAPRRARRWPWPARRPAPGPGWPRPPGGGSCRR